MPALMGAPTATLEGVPSVFPKHAISEKMGVAQNYTGWLRRFWSTFPLTRVPFWYRFFEPQPD